MPTNLQLLPEPVFQLRVLPSVVRYEVWPSDDLGEPPSPRKRDLLNNMSGEVTCIRTYDNRFFKALKKQRM